MKIRVKKRDKSEELYNPEKIVRVVKAAGLNDKQAKELAGSVTNWFKEKPVESITSLQIRDRVLVEIQKIDKNVAKKFIWYEKYKDKNYGVKY